MRVVLPVLLAGCAYASGEPRSDEGPLVIELFTSQGCSSCPPAEQLLSRLAHDGELGGRALAPLAFHVDYWNDLGWTDPYSVPAWTERQRAYAQALGDRVYTPELVVAGAAGMVGSQSGRVVQAIAVAPRQRKLTATARWEAARVTITATAPADADAYVALWQDGIRTAVASGENAGHTLIGDRVVRRLELVAASGHTATLVLPLNPLDPHDPSWRADGAVVFAQRSDRRITGATLLAR
jgi:hypothetical protein